jgi:hypothetical protein
MQRKAMKIGSGMIDRQTDERTYQGQIRQGAKNSTVARPTYINRFKSLHFKKKSQMEYFTLIK